MIYNNLVVVDASAIVALLTTDAHGEWVAGELAGRRRSAPTIMAYEVMNILRRLVRAGVIDDRASAVAREGLAELAVDAWPHGGIADRAWELRGAVTYYDATYVALAEQLRAPLITLDGRLARSNGPTCEIRIP